MGCNAKNGDCWEVEQTMTLEARINPWTATAVICMMEKEKRGGHGQKLYADTQSCMLKLVIGKLVGNVRSVVEYWVPKSLQATEP